MHDAEVVFLLVGFQILPAWFLSFYLGDEHVQIISEFIVNVYV